MKQYPRCLKQLSLHFFLHISGCYAAQYTSFKTNNGTCFARKETSQSCTRYYSILYNGCGPFITNLRQHVVYLHRYSKCNRRLGRRKGSRSIPRIKDRQWHIAETAKTSYYSFVRIFKLNLDLALVFIASSY